MKYKVVVKKPKILEDFEKKRDNVATVIVRSYGKEIKNCTVKLYLNKNAMLGMGKSLIRYAHNKEGMKSPLHFYRIHPGEDLMQNLGIFLASKSIEPIIGNAELGIIDDIIKVTK